MERLLCRILRAAIRSWPASADVTLEQRFLDACREHGIAALVHHRARTAPNWPDWPATVRAGLARETAMRAALDMLRETCFPDAHYVPAQYGARTRLALPWWYLRRAIEGIGRWSGVGPARVEMRLDADAP